MPIVLALAGIALLFVAGAAIAEARNRAAIGELIGEAPPGDDLPGILARLAQGSPPAAPGEPAGPAAADQPLAGGAALLDALGGAVARIWHLPERAAPYAEAISQAEAKYGLPEGLLARTLYEESRFRPEIIDGTVRSSAGAIGIAQFMPATAREAGIDPADPHQAIPAAARYLRGLFDRFGSWAEALAAYNWGQGNVQRKGLDAAPAETKRYTSAILGDLGLG